MRHEDRAGSNPVPSDLQRLERRLVQSLQRPGLRARCGGYDLEGNPGVCLAILCSALVARTEQLTGGSIRKALEQYEAILEHSTRNGSGCRSGPAGGDAVNRPRTFLGPGGRKVGYRRAPRT